MVDATCYMLPGTWSLSAVARVQMPGLMISIAPLPPRPSTLPEKPPEQVRDRAQENSSPSPTERSTPEEEHTLLVKLAGLESEEASACMELRARVLRASGKYHEALSDFQVTLPWMCAHTARRCCEHCLAFVPRLSYWLGLGGGALVPAMACGVLAMASCLLACLV